VPGVVIGVMVPDIPVLFATDRQPVLTGVYAMSLLLTRKA